MKLADAKKRPSRSGGKNLDRSKVVRDLVQDNWYVQHVNRWIQDNPDAPWEFKHESKASDDAWHPSGDCTPSIEDLYAKAVGEAEERPAKLEMQKTWMTGHYWHAWLQWITVNGLGFADWDAVERRGHHWWGEPSVHAVSEAYMQDPARSEVTTKSGVAFPASNLPRRGDDLLVPDPYHWATGSADVCPADLPGKGLVLLDYKTMNGRDFNRNEPPSWCAAKWECQLNIYLDFFDVEEWGVLVGVEKDHPHGFKEFHYRRNQPLIEAIYEKWYLVAELVDSGVDPRLMDADELEALQVHLPLEGPVA